MKFISIDIECNQPSDSIIQIGALAFDTLKNDFTHSFVAYLELPEGEELNLQYPLKGGDSTLGDLLPRSTVKKFFNHSRPRAEVFKEFWWWTEEVGGKRKIVQWGTLDLKLLINQSRDVGVSTNMSNSYSYDLKDMYRLLFQPAMKWDKKAGLVRACESAMVDGFIGSPHDAYWDAHNTGFLALRMFTIVEHMNKIEQLGREYGIHEIG